MTKWNIPFRTMQSALFHWKFFFSFQIDCNDVVLFWRIQQMLKVTANALRQQVGARTIFLADFLSKDIQGVIP